MVLVIGPEGKREKLGLKLDHFKPTQSVKNLAVTFDSELSFNLNIQNVTKVLPSHDDGDLCVFGGGGGFKLTAAFLVNAAFNLSFYLKAAIQRNFDFT